MGDMKTSKLSKKNIIIYISVIVLGVLLDQLTKLKVASNMLPYEKIEMFKGFFNFTYVQNHGAAWGMMQGKMNLFFLISFVAAIFISYYFYDSKPYQKLTRLGCVCVFTGLVGNLIDRISFGYVRDFFDFIIFNYDFPVFNVADIFITLGTVMLMIELVIEEYKTWKLSKLK